MTKYELTAAARARLEPHHSRWLRIGLNTEPMTNEDRDIVRRAIARLYRAAQLEPPPPERIVFVASPLVMRLAGSIAAAILHMRRHPEFLIDAATDDALEDAACAAIAVDACVKVNNATQFAIENAIGAATDEATFYETLRATAGASKDATWNVWVATDRAVLDDVLAMRHRALGAITVAAVCVATAAATGASAAQTRPFVEAATEITMNAASSPSSMTDFLTRCSLIGFPLEHGGEWVGSEEWVEFLREECGYERDGRLDYTAWHPWRDAALHGGLRMTRADFCIVSDRPAEIHLEYVAGHGRLHNVTGPAKRYADGWSIYAVHGVRVPAKVIEAPQDITADDIRAEPDRNVRRIMRDRLRAVSSGVRRGRNAPQSERHGNVNAVDAGF